MNPYYDADGVTIYCGDALEVLPTLRASSVGAVITDPPYVIGAVSAGTLNSKAGGWGDLMNSAFWFAEWYRLVARAVHPAGSFWSFCNWRSLPVVMRAASDAGVPITSCAVWSKEWIGPGGSQGLRPAYELIVLSGGPEFAIADRGIADVIPCKVGSHKPHGHPAEKPERLLERLVEIAIPGAPYEGRPSLVVDPFAGSGTTVAACRKLGVPVVAIEAEERWCEVIAERCAQGRLL